MKYLFNALLTLSCCFAFAQNNSAGNTQLRHKEYHVSVNGNDTNDGSLTRPLKTITAASKLAMPGDVITVHAGIYREEITPARGENSE